MNTNLLTNINYSITRHFKKFRKHLRREALDYKFGTKNTHKNMHAIPLDLRRKLMNKKRGGDWNTIHKLEQESYKPFGKITKKGVFLMDKERIPFYDIPEDLDSFELKPYVDFNTPKLPEKYINHQVKVNQEKVAVLLRKSLTS